VRAPRRSVRGYGQQREETDGEEWHEMWWRRAIASYHAARRNREHDPDTAVSLAYCAARCALSAHWCPKPETLEPFADLDRGIPLDDCLRDLSCELDVHASGEKLASSYSKLWGNLRGTGFSPEMAADAIQKAGQILQAVSQADPRRFPSLPDPE